MIIHIAGLSGSGKTTLGKRLSKNKNIIVEFKYFQLLYERFE